MTDLAVASTPAPTSPAPTPAASSAAPRSGDHFNRVLDRVRDQRRPDRTDPRGGRSAADTARNPASRGHHPPTGEVRADAGHSRSARHTEPAPSATTAGTTTAAAGHGHASTTPADAPPAAPPAPSPTATTGDIEAVAAPSTPLASVPGPDPTEREATDLAQLSTPLDASVPEASPLPSTPPLPERQAAPVLPVAVLSTPHLDPNLASGGASVVAPAGAPDSEEPADELEVPVPAPPTHGDHTDPLAPMPELVMSPVSAAGWIAAAPVLPAPQPQPHDAVIADSATTDSVVAATNASSAAPASPVPAPVAEEHASIAPFPVAAPALSGTTVPEAPQPPTVQIAAAPAGSDQPSAPAPEARRSALTPEATIDTASVVDAAGAVAPGAAPAPAAPSAAPSGLGALTPASVRPDAPTVTTSTVPASPTDAEPWQQVHHALGSLRSFSDGSEQIRVRLHPEELGEVLVEVTALRGELRINLVTETPAARERLNAELGQLASKLAESGLQASSLDVGSGNDRGRPGGERQERSPDARPGSPVEPRLPVSAGARSPRSGGTGRIDLVL